jgi:APA family basic amino acid/polyamine antiporter
VALTGRYDQILGYVVFADWVFFGLSAASLFLLRRRGIGGEPSAIRFPVPGHPWTTGAFVVVSALVVLSTVRAYPANTAIGLAVLLAGLPAYWLLTRRASPTVSSADS